ncbi:Undecaprenyl-phosphate alpha-N-acetylglucosaminyl 1-phosphate transferase [compost metagenome]
MFYLQYGVALFCLMLLYIFIAKRFNIVDIPNLRSSHNHIIVRGAGVVFPLSLIAYTITFSQYYPHFIYVFAGAMLISFISFIDDIRSLPVYVRLPIHVISVLMLMHGFSVFEHWPLWFSTSLLFIMLGIINAYNFMDGINGMTALYSLISFSSFWFVIKYTEHMESTAFVNYGIVSCIVFLFFNFRKRAICFLGDVGSIGLGFWTVAALCYIIFLQHHFEYILFLSVYGIDTGYTILERLRKRENIFKPHRQHLYQRLANEGKQSHLVISTIYASVQLAVNAVVVFTNWNIIITGLVIMIPLSITYFGLKRKYL